MVSNFFKLLYLVPRKVELTYVINFKRRRESLEIARVRMLVCLILIEHLPFSPRSFFFFFSIFTAIHLPTCNEAPFETESCV